MKAVLFNIKRLLKKNLVFFVPFLVSCIVWMNSRFFSPGTFIYYGDMSFPIDSSLYLKSMLFLWIENNGIGVHSIYSPFLLLALIVRFLDLIKIPLWIINRFWVVLPLATVGWGTYYLYRGLSNDKHVKICGLIAAVFAMLCPSSEIYAFQYLSLGGFALLMGVIVRIIDGKKIGMFGIFVSILGMFLLHVTPRYAYITCMLIICYVCLSFIAERNFFWEKISQIVKVSFWIIIISSFLMVPLGQFFISIKGELSSAFYSNRTPAGYLTGLDLWHRYSEWVNPLWILRLLIANPYAPVTPFMTIPYISFLTFILPLLAISGVMLLKEKKILILYVIAFILILLSIAPSNPFLTKIFLFLWHNLPGFLIFKSPIFFVIFLGIFYAVFLGLVIEVILKKIDRSKHNIFLKIKKEKFKKSLITLILLLIVFVHGGPLVIGVSPEESLAGWGNVIYVNHVTSMKIPKQYYELKAYLFENSDKNDYRVLNLPWTHGSYIPYKWWPYYDVPEVINFLSVSPVLGGSFPPSEGVLVSIADFIISNEIKDAVGVMNFLRIRYVLVHKDYFAIPGSFEPDKEAEVYINNLRNNQELLEVVMDNKNFVLFKIIGDVLITYLGQ